MELLGWLDWEDTRTSALAHALARGCQEIDLLRTARQGFNLRQDQEF
jgi:hypothetical protein